MSKFFLMSDKLETVLSNHAPSILITLISHLGDTLLYTPALKALRRKFPSADITAVANPLTLPALLGNRDLNRIVLLCPGHFNLSGTEISSAGIDVFTDETHFFREMSRRNFDVILNFSASVRDYVSSYKTGGKYRIAPVYKNMAVSRFVSFFTVHGRVFCDDDPGMYSKNPGSYRLLHEVEQNFKVVSALSVEPVDSGLIMPLSSQDGELADDVLKGIEPGRGFIALQVSDRWFWAGWREKGLIRLLKEMEEMFPGYSILCFSYPTVEDMARNVFEGICGEGAFNERSIPADGILRHENPEITVLSGRKRPLFLMNNLPLKVFASVLKKCSLLVTMHSGATHISASVGLRSLVVFNGEYFDYFSRRECPWQVDFRPVKKNLDEKGFQALGEKEKDIALNGHLEDIMGAMSGFLAP